MYVLIAIVLLGVLIMVHEAGHFFAARLMGIDVMEFSIGFGPKLLGWKSRRHETAFSLRAIPLGGYCAFYGEDDAKGTHGKDPRAYNNQNVWKRMFCVAMGPLMNFVLAFAVLFGFYCLVGVYSYDPVLVQVDPAGPAYAAGLRDGDLVCVVNGRDVRDGTAQTLIDMIASYRPGDAPLHVEALRGDEWVAADVTPVWVQEEGRAYMQVTIQSTPRMVTDAAGGERVATRRLTAGESLSASWSVCVNASGMILGALRELVTTGEGLDQTSGPVGVVTLVSREVREGGALAFINLMVVLSINLGVMNLLPIPGLDGSRLVFHLVEAVRRKPVPPEKEAMVHLVGMGFLFAVMIFFTFKDVMRLFQ